MRPILKERCLDCHKYPQRHVQISEFSKQQKEGFNCGARIHRFVKAVTPVKTGVQEFCDSVNKMDSGFRRNDGERALKTSCDSVKIALSLMAFVLRLDMNLGKDRAKAKGEAIRDQDLLGIPSSDEL
jgi:hypothetical protein